MLIRLIALRVQPQHMAAFQAASLANLAASLVEPGVVRFEFYQHSDDPARFTVLEVYRDDAAREAHLRTPHFLAWRQAAAEMLAEPLASSPVRQLFP